MQTPRLIDPATMTDAELSEVYALSRAGRLDAAPDEPAFSVEQMVASARSWPAAFRISEWVIEGGYAQLFRFGENKDCELELVISPEARRSGLGTLLVGYVAEQARAAGCTMMLMPFADERGAAFTASLGARNDNSWFVNVITLPAVLEQVQPVPGYSVRSWQGPTPEELMESWVRGLNAVKDAPHAAGTEPWVHTAQFVRGYEASLIAGGEQPRSTVILDAHGEAAAVTGLKVGLKPGAMACTDVTAVVPEHRRRGLARWLKTESLAQLMADRPDVPLMRTNNGVTNAGMLAVNRAVGFKPVATWTNAVIDL